MGQGAEPKMEIRMKTACVLFLAATIPAVGQTAPELAALVDAQLPSLVATYKNLHQHPRAFPLRGANRAFIAAELRKVGYEVTEHVGVYPDGSRAYGVVSVMKNGPGPTVLVRTDLDALPVQEKTGLSTPAPSTARRWKASKHPRCTPAGTTST